ncbi:MAG: AAA family ATPase [bacterium]|nr:AAA family ATPase [bacterium]
MEKNFLPKSEKIDVTIKKKPQEDPVGLFLERFDKTLDIEHAVKGEIDLSYLTAEQKAESMWAVFQNIQKAVIRIKVRQEMNETRRELKDKKREPSEEELNDLRLGLGMIKNLYADEEVKKAYRDNYQRHIQESKSINGDLENFKVLKKTILFEEKNFDDYSKRIFGKRGKTTEIDRLLFKTSKNRLGEIRNKLKDLLDTNAELRVLDQFEKISEYAKQLEEEGYMWLPSRRKALEDFEEAAIFGGPLLVFGESGTGKTELIRATSVKLTGKISAETGGKNVRLQDLVAKPAIAGDRNFYKFGDIGRAATGKTTTLEDERMDDGRIVIDDEFNLLDQAEQIERLAKIASWKPGRRVMLPGITEEIEIAPNFLYCASVNLASEKYAGGRKDIPLEVMRKFRKKMEVGFLSREEIYDAMQAALMDENGRMRVAKGEIGPAYDEKEEIKTVEKDGQKIKQNVRVWEMREQEERGGKTVASGGFIWRLSGAIDQLNKSIAHEETVLKSKGEAQYLNKILIDIGQITQFMKNYIATEDKISLEQFVIEEIRSQFSEMKSFSMEDRELTREFFAHFDIDLNDDAEKLISKFEIMTPRDIGLLSPYVKYEKVVSEEPVLSESFYVSVEGKRVEYKIQKFEKDGTEFIPGEVYATVTEDGKKYARKFLGVDKKNGLPVLVPYKKEPNPHPENPSSFERTDISIAQKIMERGGKEFFLGPNDAEQTFGFKLEAKDIPPLEIDGKPLTREEIERHQKLGDKLVLNFDKTPDGIPLNIEEMAERALKVLGSDGNVIERDKDGKPTKYLLYKDQFAENGKLKSGAWFFGEAEIRKQTPKAGWQFVSPDILPNSTSKNYLAQTELLIENAKNNFFDGKFPPEYQEAEKEFQTKKPEIEELIKDNKYIEAVKAISTLKISNLLHEPVQNTIFRYLVSFKKGKQLFTDGKYSWSICASSDGGFLSFGDADADGAHVRGSKPDFSYGLLGVVSSRF